MFGLSPFDQNGEMLTSDTYASIESQVKAVHPEGGFLPYEQAIDEAIESRYDELCDRMADSFCDGCERGYCDDCSSYGDGEYEGYNRGYLDALRKQDHENEGASFEELLGQDKDENPDYYTK